MLVATDTRLKERGIVPTVGMTVAFNEGYDEFTFCIVEQVISHAIPADPFNSNSGMIESYHLILHALEEQYNQEIDNGYIDATGQPRPFFRLQPADSDYLYIVEDSDNV
jgi:hypothetical protein